MDAKTLQLIEFDKVLERVAEYTAFSAGRERVLTLQPAVELAEVQRRQAVTREAAALLQGDDSATIGSSHDVRPAADNALRGFVLSAETLLHIRDTLTAARTLRRTLWRDPDRHPHLAAIAAQLDDIPGLISAINTTIDDRGDVLDSASPKLARLRAELRTAHNRIQDKLRQIVSGSLSQYLQEALITVRSGRYVIPLRADHKGRIPGIIHDQSASGATLWVEPLNTVELNNSYRTLQLDEEREIERILGELSQRVGSHSESLKAVVNGMAQLDLAFAAARHALVTDSVEPVLLPWRDVPPPHPGSTLWIRAARHPLLDPATVIPTDFLLDEQIFTVLITGPNTGGKTVALKNIGLMVAMGQAGLHLPANEARLTVFRHIFADIGDEQSIEQSLSTFSAHIRNIIRILDRVDERSLVLLDELGSGTDPTEGAGIAQAIMNYLMDKGATSLVATHYPELKVYAGQTAGATNASMLFDVETLSPTYEMTIGVPGKSNALAIARRLGLDETILDDAMRLVGSGNQQTETLISTIYEMRDRISADEAATRLARRRAEAEREQLARERDDTEAQRREILAGARQQVAAELDLLRDELQRVRRNLRDAPSVTAVKKISEQISVLEAQKADALAAGNEPAASHKRFRRLMVGDSVFVRTLKSQGTVVGLQGKSAEIAVGRLTLRTDVDDLEFRQRPAEEPKKAQEKSAPAGSVPKPPLTSTVGMELDIRGERVEEGLDRLDQYLDSAMLSSIPWVRIIHGKGTGRLRQAIRDRLGMHPFVARWETGREGEGDTGVTVAYLKEA